jgi:hypothetical protein
MKGSSRKTEKSTIVRYSRRFPSMLAAFAVTAILSTVTSETIAEPRCLRVVNVDFWDVLFIRAQQTHKAKAVGAIAPDHDGIVELTGPCTPSGQSPKRQWCPVNYFPLPGVRISGYVKAYFVAPSQCPKSFSGGT